MKSAQPAKGRVLVVDDELALARPVQRRLVGEGVETAAERDTLVALGCDLLQGYLFARPAAGFPGVSW
jgi:EAL domain-containing protein (putative c-di-GMP-specific phosphodiesterase class I)